MPPLLLLLVFAFSAGPQLFADALLIDPDQAPTHSGQSVTFSGLVVVVFVSKHGNQFPSVPHLLTCPQHARQERLEDLYSLPFETTARYDASDRVGEFRATTGEPVTFGPTTGLWIKASIEDRRGEPCPVNVRGIDDLPCALSQAGP
jgi:hypothetical protein